MLARLIVNLFIAAVTGISLLTLRVFCSHNLPGVGRSLWLPRLFR